MMIPLIAVLEVALVIPQTSRASSLVEVSLRDGSDLEALARGGFDLAYLSPGWTADVIIHNEEEMNRLIASGLLFRMVHQDLEAFVEQRLAPPRDDMLGYPTYDEITDDIHQLADDFPNIVAEPVAIGRSIEDREIWAVKISDHPDEDEDEPEILITSLIHAREVITPEVTLAVMHLLTDGYGEDERITRLVDERQIWFIPCHNPDGYVFNEEDNGERMWRKNRRRNDDGSIGVDLNRNFGFQWGYDNIGSSPRGRDQTYRGTAPFSEPESQAVREFVNQHDFRISLYYHSYSNLCIYPFGYDFIPADQPELFRALGARLTEVSGYWVGTGWEIIYLTNGDSDDWLYGSDEHDQVLAMTIEVGNRDDNFWPPRERVEPLVNENLPLCINAIDFADEPRRAFPPPVPAEVTVYRDHIGMPHVEWVSPADEINPAVAFNLMTRRCGEPFIDQIENEDEVTGRWKVKYFILTRVFPHSEPNCLRVETRASMATLELRDDIVAPDTLTAWLRYRLNGGGGLALDVATDGFDWQPVEGLNTQEIIRGGYNHGPGIQHRNSNGWRRQWWNLGDWEGQSVRIRFRYVRFNNFNNRDYIYIDDIGPLPDVDWSEVAAEGLENNVWIGDEEMDEETEFLVQAVDADGHRSLWSPPARPVEAPPFFTLVVDRGWTMISLPLRPDEPALEALFAPWIEREVLTMVKNGNGEFFLPDHNFNMIGDWDTLSGYLVLLEQRDSLTVEGDPLPVDSPIPLELGWNMIPYFPDRPIAPEEALESIVDHLLFAKDDHGRFWAVRHDFNNMEDLAPGHGYLVKVEQRDTLIYPAGQERIDSQYISLLRNPDEFTPPGPDNHSIILRFEFPVRPGEIILRDNDGGLAGVGRIDQTASNLGIAAWGEARPGSRGFANGEAFRVYWRPQAGGLEIPLELDRLEGDRSYRVNGFSIFAAKIASGFLIPIQSGLVDAYPNPFNRAVRLSYEIDTPSDVQLAVYDGAGRMIELVASGHQTAGRYELVWDCGSRPSGVYIARLVERSKGTAHASQTKLLLLR